MPPNPTHGARVRREIIDIVISDSDGAAGAVRLEGRCRGFRGVGPGLLQGSQRQECVEAIRLRDDSSYVLEGVSQFGISWVLGPI